MTDKLRWLSYGIIVASTAIVSCADPPGPPKFSQQEKNALGDKLHACLAANVGALDDHKSDAKTIAEGLASACHREFNAWATAFSADLPNHVARNMFMERVMDQEVNMIVPFVLRSRASQQ